MLGEQLKILSELELELDVDLEAIGFEVPEIDLLIDGLNTVLEADPHDRLPEISESAVTVSGDLWQLGKHRVLCGNSLSTASYQRLMEGSKADLVITDPPTMSLSSERRQRRSRRLRWRLICRVAGGRAGRGRRWISCGRRVR
jgi:hypothetical protein